MYNEQPWCPSAQNCEYMHVGAPEAARPDAGEAEAVAFKDRLVEVRRGSLHICLSASLIPGFCGVGVLWSHGPFATHHVGTTSCTGMCFFLHGSMCRPLGKAQNPGV